MLGLLRPLRPECTDSGPSYLRPSLVVFGTGSQSTNQSLMFLTYPLTTKEKKFSEMDETSHISCMRPKNHFTFWNWVNIWQRSWDTAPSFCRRLVMDGNFCILKIISDNSTFFLIQDKQVIFFNIFKSKKCKIYISLFNKYFKSSNNFFI